jgi:hypothetical protein
MIVAGIAVGAVRTSIAFHSQQTMRVATGHPAIPAGS